MKRIAVLGLAAFVGLASTASTARAQLTMQMSNGWSFSLSGNVNAFLVESWNNSKATPAVINGGITTQGTGTLSNISTGLLPADLNFDIKGHEGPVDLGVHFGFYPEIQNGAGINGGAGNGHDQFGAQIDMREVYLTVGGGWGQILAGRALDPFLRENILNDATLFGTGPVAGNRGNGGTTFGRIGYGYIYPNFNAQIAYSTKAGNPLVLTLAVLQPSEVGWSDGVGSLANSSASYFSFNPLPRVEGELTFTTAVGTAGSSTASKLKAWVNGQWQEAKHDPTGFGPQQTIQSEGLGAGVKFDISIVSLVGSGYYGRGLGSTFEFGATSTDGNPTGPQTRTSYGYIGQATVKLTDKWSVVGSYGSSFIDGTHYDKTIGDGPNPFVPTQSYGYSDLLKYNAAGVGAIQYQWTKSLRAVGEYTYATSANVAGGKNIQNNISAGLMLFF
jgi:hypothetical protein